MQCRQEAKNSLAALKLWQHMSMYVTVRLTFANVTAGLYNSENSKGQNISIKLQRDTKIYFILM